MTLVIAAAQSTSVPGDVSRNVEIHVRFGALAAECGARLLIFPELSLTGYEPALAPSCALRPDDPRLDSLRRLSEEANMTVVAGAPVRNGEDQVHIAALVFRPDGSGLVYTKEYLHPGEEEVFAPGTGGDLFRVEDANVGLAICADTNHPRHPANAADRGANVYATGVLLPRVRARSAPRMAGWSRLAVERRRR